MPDSEPNCNFAGTLAHRSRWQSLRRPCWPAGPHRGEMPRTRPDQRARPHPVPAADTLLHFQRDPRIERRWLLDGGHYAKTANHWLERQDGHRGEVLAVLNQRYGKSAVLWLNRWRLLWMACAELFGYANGSEWLIAHYLCERAAPANIL